MRVLIGIAIVVIYACYKVGVEAVLGRMKDYVFVYVITLLLFVAGFVVGHFADRGGVGNALYVIGGFFLIGSVVMTIEGD